MFPRLRQRLLILLTIAVGIGCWHVALPLVRRPGLGDGLVLSDAAAGWLLGAGAVLVLGLPCLVLGLVTAARGNPMSGLFGVAVAMVVTAWRAGPIDGWLVHATLPGDYTTLLLELGLWQAGLVGMLFAMQTLRSPMRSRVPALAFDDHLGERMTMELPHTASLTAGVMAAIVAGGIGWFLIRDSSPGQVLVSLTLAFGAGGTVAHMIVRHDNPVGILFSPALVAAAAYVWVTMKYDTTQQVLAAWHAGELPGLVLALPVHYVAAGVAGCALGIGWAEVMMASERPATEPAGAAS